MAFVLSNDLVSFGPVMIVQLDEDNALWVISTIPDAFEVLGAILFSHHSESETVRMEEQAISLLEKAKLAELGDVHVGVNHWVTAFI
jgi:hypothetical protein